MNAGFKLPIAAIVMVIVCAVMYFSIPGDVDSGDVRYDYVVELTDSFESTSEYRDVVTAPAGKQFAVVTWTIANDSFKDGFSTNDLIFQSDVVVDGLIYTPQIIGFEHPGYVSASIAEGHTASFVYVYQIPAGTSVDGVEVVFEYVTVYPPDMIKDESIRNDVGST